MADDCKPVRVSRRITAPAGRIFAILADPARHLDIDGSGMLRGIVSGTAVSGVGDVFLMKMYFEPLGDYVMINRVVQYKPDRCIEWEPAPGDATSAQDGAFTIGVSPGHRWRFDLDPDGEGATVVTETFDCSAAPESLRHALHNGETWIEAMTITLGRLDALCGG
jgi:hypothetical protein